MRFFVALVLLTFIFRTVKAFLSTKLTILRDETGKIRHISWI